jgi:2'-5' RNA ligase
LAEALADVARVAAERLGGRPTRRETIHLTLAFLGDVPVSELPELYAAGERVRASSFALKIDRCGYWQHNGVFWAGLGGRQDGLHDLYRQLRAALGESGFRPDPQERRYTPHLTLIRRVPVPGDEPMQTIRQGFRSLDWLCASYALVRSDLSASGPHYTPLREFPLA